MADVNENASGSSNPGSFPTDIQLTNENQIAGFRKSQKLSVAQQLRRPERLTNMWYQFKL